MYFHGEHEDIEMNQKGPYLLRRYNWKSRMDK